MKTENVTPQADRTPCRRMSPASARPVTIATSREMAGLALVGYCLIIFLISAHPRPQEDLNLPTGPLPHFLEFAGLGFIAWVNAALRRTWSTRRRFVTAWVLCALFAASDELHQAFVPPRACEFADWVFDVLGVTAALVAAQWLENRGLLRVKRRL
jgi:VanZ family protein